MPVSSNTDLIPDGIDLANDKAPLPERIGRFNVLGRLGRTSSGVAYDASTDKGQRVVLKLARASSPEVARRIARELSILRKLNHPGVVKLVDSGVTGDLFYVAIERVEGVTLRSMMGRLDLDAILSIALHVGSTLAYLHEVGVIHREVAPDAIIIVASGKPILADFGLAMLTRGAAITQAGVSVGPVEYRAPEIDKGERASPRSDQYALGRLLFDVCATQPKPGDADPADIDWSRFPRGGWFDTLHEIVSRMLSKRPGDRYRDMHACIGALGRLASLKALGGGALVKPGEAGGISTGDLPGFDPDPITSDKLVRFIEHVDRAHNDSADEGVDVELSESFSDISRPKTATKYILISNEDVVASIDVGPWVRTVRPLCESPTMPEHRPTEVIEKTPVVEATPAQLAASSKAQAQAFWEERAGELDISDLADISEIADIADLDDLTDLDGGLPVPGREESVTTDRSNAMQGRSVLGFTEDKITDPEAAAFPIAPMMPFEPQQSVQVSAPITPIVPVAPVAPIAPIAPVPPVAHAAAASPHASQHGAASARGATRRVIERVAIPAGSPSSNPAASPIAGPTSNPHQKAHAEPHLNAVPAPSPSIGASPANGGGAHSAAMNGGAGASAHVHAGAGTGAQAHAGANVHASASPAPSSPPPRRRSVSMFVVMGAVLGFAGGIAALEWSRIDRTPETTADTSTKALTFLALPPPQPNTGLLYTKRRVKKQARNQTERADLERAQLALATAREKLGHRDLRTAQILLGECIESADVPECHRTLALVLALTGDAAARAHLQRYLELAPNAEDAPLVRAALVEKARLGAGE